MTTETMEPAVLGATGLEAAGSVTDRAWLALDVIGVATVGTYSAYAVFRAPRSLC